MQTKLPISALLVASLALVACSKEKPAGSSDSTTTAAPIVKQATSAPAPVPTAPQAAKATAAAPKKLPADKKRAVPAEWTRLADPKAGFAFSLPSEAQLASDVHDGVAMHIAELDKPHRVRAAVTVYKDASKTLDALESDVKEVLQALSNKDVKILGRRELTGDYRLVDVESTDEHGEKWRLKALVATDVTDNYLFIVGSPSREFAADEATIDEIWGSFEMWSGGANGESY
jgi:hypothetical protein